MSKPLLTTSHPPTNPIPTTPSPTITTHTYPFAAAPDIIRSNQKDAYFQSHLYENFSTIFRRLYGSRIAHAYASEAHTCTELLYLGLTTLIGNRTLGEEYCDIHQIESNDQKLPSIQRRAGYILSVVLLPYSLSKVLPALRARIRLKLERNISQTSKASSSSRLQSYILTHLQTLTSPSPIYALSLATFYFTGSYYHLSKRLFSLRYIFPKRLLPSEQRVGYEVLGVLLVLQMIVQAYFHIRSTITTTLPTEGSSAILDDGVEVGLSQQQNSNEGKSVTTSPVDSRARIALATQTPLPASEQPRYDLSDPNMLAWLQPKQQRKCTLCLEPMSDPSVTTCGHVFCWTCILDWVAEKPECPLCRQGVLGQHVLPLRG